MNADKQGYQQSYDAALVGADRSKDIVVLRLINLQVRHADMICCDTESFLACVLVNLCPLEFAIKL